MSERDAARKPYMLKPGEGNSVWSLGGRFTMKVTGKDSDLGRAATSEVVGPPRRARG